MDNAGRDLSRVAPEVLVGTDDALDREAKGRRAGAVVDRDGFEKFQQAGAVEPRHGGAAADDVVALEGADGDEVRVRGVQVREEFAEFGFYRAEDLLVVALEIHLVDGNGEVR